MRIIDADGHVLERDIPWADLIDAPYRSRAPRAVQDNRGYTFIMIDGKLTPKPVGKGCSARLQRLAGAILRRGSAAPQGRSGSRHSRSGRVGE